MYKKTETVWMDGTFLPWSEAKVHVLTHTLHYGVGVFEGIRYYDCGDKGSAIFRLQDHIRRFQESCQIVAMDLPFSQDEIINACIELAKVNGLKEGYIRPLAYIADEPNAGLWAYDNPVRIAILTWGWGAYLGEEGLAKGIRAKTSSFTRHHRNIGMTKGKVTGQYFNSVMAKREAKMAGCDEAIMLDPEGFVAEGTGENIFVVRDGIVQTPTLGSILNGITRSTILTLLDSQKYRVFQTQLTRDDLYIADEVFITGTAAEVTPVREVDAREIGTGKPGPITTKMQEMYADVIRGKNKDHRDWLTFIER